MDDGSTTEILWCDCESPWPFESEPCIWRNNPGMWMLPTLPILTKCETLENATLCNTAFHARLYPPPRRSYAERCLWIMDHSVSRCLPPVANPPCSVPLSAPPAPPPSSLNTRPPPKRSSPPHGRPLQAASLSDNSGLPVPFTVNHVALMVAICSCAVLLCWCYTIMRRRVGQLAREERRMAMSVATPRAELLDPSPLEIMSALPERGADHLAAEHGDTRSPRLDSTLASRGAAILLPRRVTPAMAAAISETLPLAIRGATTRTVAPRVLLWDGSDSLQRPSGSGSGSAGSAATRCPFHLHHNHALWDDLSVSELRSAKRAASATSSASLSDEEINCCSSRCVSEANSSNEEICAIFDAHVKG